jgi:anti-sigma factor RsiW
MMRCPNEIKLQSYFDHELNPRHTRRIRRHLAGCAECRNKVAQYGWVVDTLQRVLGPASIRTDEPPVPHRPALGWEQMALAAAFVVAIGFSGWYFSVWKGQPVIAPQDEELTEQYLSLHMDEVNGGENG